MKKILLFVSTLYPGGAETLVKDYALLLDKKKFSVTILCLVRLNSEYEKILMKRGIKVIFLQDYLLGHSSSFFCRCCSSFFWRFRFNYLFARWIVKRIKPDVIHAHLLVLRYLRHFDLKKVKKIFYTVHSEPDKYWHGKTNESIDEYVAAQWLVKNKNMQLIALQESMRVKLNAMFGVNNTIVVNNGIDFSSFTKPTSAQNVRQKLNIPNKAFVVGHVGRFAEPKNHFFIIDVFYKLASKRNDAYLILVGDGPLRPAVVKKIKDLQIDTRVKILGNRTDVPSLLNAMDVFFFPSVYEGLGIALIEAQKMGLPCVISDRVPSAAVISNLVSVLSLECPKDLWANALCKPVPSNIEYYNLEKWDMNNVVKELEVLYCE